MRVSTRWRIAWDILGTVTGGFLLIGNFLVVVPIAHLFHLPALAGLVLVLVVATVLLFVSFRALLMVTFLRTYTFFPVAAVKRYALATATTVTTAFLLIGILLNTELACLAFIPLVVVLFVNPLLRKHYGVSLSNLI
jgi:hypothetical protein